MRSLRTKLIAMLLGLMILGMVPIFLDTYNNILSSMMKEKKDYLLQATTSEALKIGDKIDYAMHTTERVSHDENLLNAGDNKKINDELEGGTIKDFVINLNIANQNGVVTNSSDASLIGKNFANELFFKNALANQSSVDSHINFKDKKMQFYAYAPITNPAGNITGVVFGEILEESLFKNMTDTTLHDIGDLVVTGKDGIVLHSTQDEDHFKSLWTLSDSEKKDMQTRYNDKDADPESMQYDEVKDKVAGYSNPSVFDFFCKEDRENEIMTIAQAGSYPLYLTTEFEKEGVQDALIKNIILRILIACTVVGIIIVIIGVLSINHLLKPLKSLRRAVESIGRGNLDQKINIKTHDEFRDLGNAIETMASDLRKADVIKEAKLSQTPKEDQAPEQSSGSDENKEDTDNA